MLQYKKSTVLDAHLNPTIWQIPHKSGYTPHKSGYTRPTKYRTVGTTIAFRHIKLLSRGDVQVVR